LFKPIDERKEPDRLPKVDRANARDRSPHQRMLDAEKNQLRAVAGGARQVCALEGLGIEQI